MQLSKSSTHKKVLFSLLCFFSYQETSSFDIPNGEVFDSVFQNIAQEIFPDIDTIKTIINTSAGFAYSVGSYIAPDARMIGMHVTASVITQLMLMAIQNKTNPFDPTKQFIEEQERTFAIGNTTENKVCGNIMKENSIRNLTLCRLNQTEEWAKKNCTPEQREIIFANINLQRIELDESYIATIENSSVDDKIKNLLIINVRNHQQELQKKILNIQLKNQS